MKKKISIVWKPLLCYLHHWNSHAWGRRMRSMSKEKQNTEGACETTTVRCSTLAICHLSGPSWPWVPGPSKHYLSNLRNEKWRVLCWHCAWHSEVMVPSNQFTHSLPLCHQIHIFCSGKSLVNSWNWGAKGMHCARVEFQKRNVAQIVVCVCVCESRAAINSRCHASTTCSNK